MKLFAAKGKVEIQAQSDNIDIIADKVMKLISAKESIHLVAKKEVLITAGTSYLKINEGGIEHGTLGGFTVHSAAKSFTGPKNMPYPLPAMPKHYSEFFVIRSQDTNKPIPNYAYKIKRPTGEIVEGQTDKDGNTKAVASMNPEKITLVVDETQRGEIQAYYAGDKSQRTLEVEMRSTTKNKS